MHSPQRHYRAWLTTGDGEMNIGTPLLLLPVVEKQLCARICCNVLHVLSGIYGVQPGNVTSSGVGVVKNQPLCVTEFSGDADNKVMACLTWTSSV